MYQETEVVVDNADVGRTTSSNGQGWRLLRQQDWLKIEIVGEESYAPPTLHLEVDIERRRTTTTSLYDVVSAYVTAYVTVCVFPLVHVTQMWTVWITVLVALSRYVAICRPYQAPRLCTMRRVRQQVVAVALTVLVYNVPRFLEFRIEYVPGQVNSYNFIADWLMLQTGKCQIK